MAVYAQSPGLPISPAREAAMLQTIVGPADVAADALRVCHMASGFGFADHVLIIILLLLQGLHAQRRRSSSE
jgi:hypothetical protein